MNEEQDSITKYNMCACIHEMTVIKNQHPLIYFELILVVAFFSFQLAHYGYKFAVSSYLGPCIIKDLPKVAVGPLHLT